MIPHTGVEVLSQVIGYRTSELVRRIIPVAHRSQLPFICLEEGEIWENGAHIVPTGSSGCASERFLGEHSQWHVEVVARVKHEDGMRVADVRGSSRNVE
jgi:hypothetical protein